ncbi:MAG: exopolyphosphatase / guanosine-5-triphosphate,3-diphosphate pyrophosphatase [Chloroflexota bacterium]|jgi:exopolyphosphatase/guanosine-5'-triphosphate,3'-diphosphate pyrophosphatase|nr:exopolyphosphatase / guanosine-5-triphosphate,3-diphosphate pyrophosphatase [Chloroflexota bacterium]
MRLAAVDVGSNTVHALVADVVRGRLVDVAHYVEMPELGSQVAATGSIGPRARTAIRALRSVVTQARAHNYEVLIAGATEAVRQASDREAFAREAGAAIGTPLRIIGANREAELSFNGVAANHAGRREWLMVDLGGASTEIAVGNARKMVRSATLPIGSGVLASAYFSDPPTLEDRARMRRAALRELAQAPDADVERLVATGGTASNLPQVLAKRNPPTVLTTADLLTCETRLDSRKAAEVAAKVQLPPNRIKAMRAGVEVLLLLLDWYGLAVLHVSHQGLRHGMLQAYLERGEDWWQAGSAGAEPG